MMNLRAIKTELVQTPAYRYDIDLLNVTLQKVKTESEKYNFTVHYALKANANIPILKTVKEFNLGADCVSGNEITRAIEAGFRSKDIVFAGVGKTDEEIMLALQNDILCFHCESVQEMEIINAIARSLNKTADIAIRMNPDIDAKTHKHITTGTKHTKFGISFDQYEEVIKKIKSLKNLRFRGLHFHIGSQIVDLEVFHSLCIKVNYIKKAFEKKACKIDYLNLGGGLGIDYVHPEKSQIADFTSYFNLFDRYLERDHYTSVHFELGRSIVGQCGNLITKVLYVKQNSTTDYVIVDAGFTELLRPALYNAYHKIENISSDMPYKSYTVVGPLCESSDEFAKNILLPETERGDLLVIRSAGAYGEVMMSNYNLRSPVKAYYSNNSRCKKEAT